MRQCRGDPRYGLGNDVLDQVGDQLANQFRAAPDVIETRIGLPISAMMAAVSGIP